MKARTPSLATHGPSERETKPCTWPRPAPGVAGPESHHTGRNCYLHYCTSLKDVPPGKTVTL